MTVYYLNPSYQVNYIYGIHKAMQFSKVPISAGRVYWSVSD